MVTKRHHHLGWSLGALCVALALSCASKLPHDLKTNTPEGLEKPLDLATVEFVDVHTGASVNLGKYMQDSGREYVLLMFGSMDCGTCNDEAMRLKSQGLGHYPLIDQDQSFEIVGVSTDAMPLRSLTPFVTRYPFFRWNDKAGEAMHTYFLPKDQPMKVPLTVMLSKHGEIKWRVLPDDADKTAINDLMTHVAETLGLTGSHGNEPPPPPGKTPGGKTPGGKTPGGKTPGGKTPGDGNVPAIDLAVEGPGRLKNVKLTDCDGHATTLDAALGLAEVRFVQVARGGCNDLCQANLAELKTLKCQGRSCAAVSLQTDAPTPAQCASGLAFKGGAEFFDVFQTYFNWAYTPIENPDTFTLTMPPVEGPLVFAFSAAGRLVYSFEGKLAKGQLAAAMAKPDFGQVARGPDFPLYAKGQGTFGFADARRKSKYTVVAAWAAYPEPVCGPCRDEAVSWSAPGALQDYCAARPEQCQVLMLDMHYPGDFNLTLDQYYDLLEHGDGKQYGGMAGWKIRLPLVLDPQTDTGPDGKGYLKRFYDGYMMALTQDLQPGGRVFIFNEEGRVLNMYMSGAAGDPVTAKIKELVGKSH